MIVKNSKNQNPRRSSAVCRRETTTSISPNTMKRKLLKLMREGMKTILTWGPISLLISLINLEIGFLKTSKELDFWVEEVSVLSGLVFTAHLKEKLLLNKFSQKTLIKLIWKKYGLVDISFRKVDNLANNSKTTLASTISADCTHTRSEQWIHGYSMNCVMSRWEVLFSN